MKQLMDKIFFFDRDGIVNRKPVGDYVKSIDEFIFNPDFFEIFRLINQKGYITALVTNQQGIGKGIMNENDLNQIHKFMQKILFNVTGFSFRHIAFCPSLKSENDYRRKPNPGMINEILNLYNHDKSNSYLIGDSVSDIKAGKNAGIKTILVNSKKATDSDYYYSTLKTFLLKNNFLVK